MRQLLMVLPAGILVVAVSGLGLGTALLHSLGLMPLVGEPVLSAQSYALVSTDLAVAAGLSLALAAASTAGAAVVGLGTALVVVHHARWVALLSTVTIPIPHLVGAAAVGLLLSNSGVAARLLGVDAASWPSLVAGPWWIAVVVEFAWKESAFIALVVASTVGAQLTSFTETAQLLGARPWRRFRLVTCPLALPSLLAASVISFVYVLSSYEVARLLGRAYPEPLAVMAVRLAGATELAGRPAGSAVAIVTAVLSLGFLGVATTLLRRSVRWSR